MARIDREQLGELLSGYIDGELDPRERQVIERVLREDESARQLLADLQRTAQAVSSLPRHAAPSSVAADIQAALERTALLDDFPAPRAHLTRGRSSWVARLAMAAMVGLVVVTGWWYIAEQSRRQHGAQLAQNARDVREADAAKEKSEVKTGSEESDLALASRVKEIATTGIPVAGLIPIPVEGPGGGAIVTSATFATVEQQLAAGVEPSSLRSQTFAVEPVRLQVTVRDRTEREAVAAKIASALAGQQLADLDTVPGPRADATASGPRFYYRGKSGVNFVAANEEQILVRASPKQLDRLLTDLASPSDAVALVAGPIAVQGVEKSRSVVQLLGEAKRSDELALDKNGAAADADRTVQDQSKTPTDGMLGGLLKIVGVDPKLLSSEAKSAARTESAPAEPASASAASDAPKPPTPPPLVERRLQDAAKSRKIDQPRGADESPEANVTVVVQIIEQPKPPPPNEPAKAKSDRPPKPKTVE